MNGLQPPDAVALNDEMNTTMRTVSSSSPGWALQVRAPASRCTREKKEPGRHKTEVRVRRRAIHATPRTDSGRRGTDHDEPRFVSVTGSRQHVWIEDQHFQEADRDTEVGDVLYDTTGAESVYEVITIDDSDSEQEVEIEHLYLGGREEPGEEGAQPTDTVSLELLRGE